MNGIPINSSSDRWAPAAPVAVSLPAGLRSLLAVPHQFPRASVSWALVCRSVLAALCFAGGLLIAQALAVDIAADARACGSCALQPSLVPFAMGCVLPLLPLLVKRLRKRLGRASELAGGLLSRPVSAAELPRLTDVRTHGESS